MPSNLKVYDHLAHVLLRVRQRLWLSRCGTGDDDMPWQMRRKLITLLAVLVVPLAAFLGLNVGGWRARILARLLRVNNWPVVVSPPPNFQPNVPPGFKVSVFARGFEQPRWLAVASNGDIFVADSAAGQVIVLAARGRGKSL
jgi:glucose/arabinose dehydrogenase